MSGSDGYETVDEEAGDTPVLEEEEDSFVDIDGTPGTRCDQEGGIRGTRMVGKRVEVVTRSGRRAGRVLYGNRCRTPAGREAGVGRHPCQYVKRVVDSGWRGLRRMRPNQQGSLKEQEGLRLPSQTGKGKTKQHINKRPTV